MSTNVRAMSCTPDDVFAVLADGWLYPSWVVGASRMRDVDENWPTPGCRLQHSVGVWPLLLNDETTVLEWDPPHRMSMQPRGWPAGEARVSIEVKARGQGCVVRLQERAVKGPATLIPARMLDLVLQARNTETLRRLSYIAEGRGDNGG